MEIQVEYEKIGLTPGEDRTIGIASDVTDTQTTWHYWPAAAQTNNPATWGVWDLQ